MAYVIAQPCIDVKDTACVDACPVDCIHPGKKEADFEGAPHSILIRWSASTAERAFRCARCRRFMPGMTCPTSGRSIRRRTPRILGGSSLVEV